MSAAIAFYDVRFMVDGSEEGWTQIRFPVDADIVVPDVVRGEDYLVQIRSVSAAGRTSAWVDCPVTVPATNREGSLALSNGTNLGSVWDYDAEVEYNSTDSTATIDFLGGTLVAEGKTISYGPSSATISVMPEEEFYLYMWLNDPRRAGGTVQLEVSRNFIDSVSAPGLVVLSPVLIQAPPIGGTSSGGGSIGGGGGGGGGGRSPETAPL